jgi:hypothetical protein
VRLSIPVLLSSSRIQFYRTYGSGYPGVAGRGVAGLPFPFFFWPLAWGGAAVGTAAYLHDDEVCLLSSIELHIADPFISMVVSTIAVGLVA